MPKPVKKKKRFIRKKEATTYRLIPGYVEDDEDDTTSTAQESKEEVEARKEEQRKFGIFYDDSYNYMKHLRSLNEQASLVSTESFRIDPDDETRSVRSGPPIFKEFFSTDITEEEEIDPDILAALEDAPEVKSPADEEGSDAGAGSVEDFLADDFIEKAGGIVPGSRDEFLEEDDRADDFISDEEEDDDPEEDDSATETGDEGEFGSEGYDDITDDRFPSIQSTQGRGTKEDDIAEAQTQLILKNFEEGYGFRCSNQISDDEEEQATAEDYDNLKRILNEDKITEKPVSWSEVLDDKSERSKVDSSKYLYEDEDEYEWKEVPPSKPKFDCVSILSLNSNTRNRPTDLIPSPAQGKKKREKSTNASENSNVPGLSLKELEEEMRESRKADKACTFRPKDENLEEKKARKKAIREERRDRRQEKKANREVFASEKERMQREAAALSKAVKGVHIS